MYLPNGNYPFRLTRWLRYEGHSRRFLDVLRVVGPTLESITYGEWLRRKDFEQLEQLCPKLSSIDLNAVYEHRAAYADLLCSYGAQLRFTVFFSFSMADCKRILSSCPNVRCHLVLETYSYLDEEMELDRKKMDALLEELKVVGPCATSLNLWLNSDEDEPSARDLAIASRSWSRLQDLTLQVCAIDALSEMNGLFNKDMPRLSSFSLIIREYPGSISSNTDVGEVLLSLSEHVGALRMFSFVGHSQDIGVFEAVARNAPVLQDVRLDFDDFDHSARVDDYEARVEDSVLSFLVCPELRLLDVVGGGSGKEPIEVIANMCSRLQLKRKRNMYVEVLGVENLA